jgi:hypothetical protein
MSTAIDFSALMRRAKRPATQVVTKSGDSAESTSKVTQEVVLTLNAREKQSLEPYRIDFKGGDVFYWPGFVSADEEKNILQCVRNFFPVCTAILVHRASFPLNAAV